MIALGIDPGTRNLGWGVVERRGNKLVHLAHGVIRAKAELTLAERLCIITDELEKVIEEHRPNVGSVEQIFFHKDPQSAAKLGHARGVVLLCLGRAKVTVAEHAPAKVKRTLTGNGQAEKRQVAEVVKMLLGLEVLPPLDASDALALALTELRLDPRARLAETARKGNLRKKVPEHVGRALAAAKKKLELQRKAK